MSSKPDKDTPGLSQSSQSSHQGAGGSAAVALHDLDEDEIRMLLVLETLANRSVHSIVDNSKSIDDMVCGETLNIIVSFVHTYIQTYKFCPFCSP